MGIADTISEDDEVIKFIDKGGEEFIFATENDCCNTVWIDHLNGLSSILGHTIHKVKEIPYRAAGVDERKMAEVSTYDALDVFGYDLYADGVCTLECRNSHNGYYGGRIGQISAEQFNDFRKNIVFREVLEDF